MNTLPLPLVTDDRPAPPAPPPPRRRAVPGGYLAFSLDHDREKARRLFEDLYGYPPAEEFEELGLWKVGPEAPL